MGGGRRAALSVALLLCLLAAPRIAAPGECTADASALTIDGAVTRGARFARPLPGGLAFELRPISPLKKAPLAGFHSTAKHIAAKAVLPSFETMRTI